MNRLKAILLHCITPITIGLCIYWLRWETSIAQPGILLYNLPDALWLFAFLSAIFIIWKGDRSGLYWSVSAIAIAFGSEYLQKFHTIPGTFDYGDLLAYAIASVASFFIASHHTKPQTI